MPLLSRRDLLASALAVLALTRPARAIHRCAHHARHHRAGGPHPTPRPGVNASKVIPDTELAETPEAIPAFDEVRQVPEVVDGIRCQCGCSSREGYYSLLSCYEGEAMARYCEICQGQGRLAFRLHRAGKSLDEIRAAIEARFG